MSRHTSGARTFAHFAAAAIVPVAERLQRPTVPPIGPCPADPAVSTRYPSRRRIVHDQDQYAWPRRDRKPETSNNDGKSDILWRDFTTGQVALWLMNGLQVLQ